jgi:hypothetical protein
MLLVLSILILSIASTIPAARATARAGKIVLNPTHAPPGTLVTFEGVGWGLEPAFGGDVGVEITQCEISGEPVKVDRRYLLCEVKYRGGTYEPVGSFMVADVPAGTYLVSVSAMFLGVVLTGEQEFTVDAMTTITTVASTTVTTLATSYTSPVTTAASSAPVVTVSATVTTTKVETPQAPDYAVMSLLLSIVAISLIAILTVLILRRRK